MKYFLSTILFISTSVFACEKSGEGPDFELAYGQAVTRARGECDRPICSVGCSMSSRVVKTWVDEKRDDYCRVRVDYRISCFCPF